MPQTAEIASQPTSDTHTKAYHVRCELSSLPVDYYRGHSSEDGEFVALFFRIRGIVRVQMGAYVMIVTKAPLYDWSEIEPQVIRLLADWTKSQNGLDMLTQVEEVA